MTQLRHKSHLGYDKYLENVADFAFGQFYGLHARGLGTTQILILFVNLIWLQRLLVHVRLRINTNIMRSYNVSGAEIFNVVFGTAVLLAVRPVGVEDAVRFLVVVDFDLFASDVKCSLHCAIRRRNICLCI